MINLNNAIATDQSINMNEFHLIIMFSRVIFATTRMVVEGLSSIAIFKEIEFYKALQAAIPSLERIHIETFRSIIRYRSKELMEILTDTLLDITTIRNNAFF